MLACSKHKSFGGAASVVAINGTKSFLYRTESKSTTTRTVLKLGKLCVCSYVGEYAGTVT